MNILVLGASQGTGALAVQAALSRGHSVTAFARADVADFLVKATESDAWLRQAVQLGG
jgi:putative NADH-flavin reductase